MDEQLSVKEVSAVDKDDIKEYIKDIYSLIETKASKDQRTVYVGLFALSTYARGAEIKATTFLYGKNEQLQYCYQLENALLKMKRESKLDYLVLLTTEETVKKPTPYKVFIVNEKTINEKKYVIKCSEEGLVKQIVMEGGVLKDPDENRIFSVMIPDPSSGTKEQFDEKMARSVSEILKDIKDIREKENGKEIEVHYFNHGAFRDLPVYLESMLSLLEDDPSIHVCKNVTVLDKRETVNSDGKKEWKSVAVVSDGGKGVSEFVAGIREFRNYCKIKSLREYYTGRTLKEPDEQLMTILSKIALGMQMSDMDLFLDGVERLKSFDNNKQFNQLIDPYLKLFYDEIVSAFPFLELDNTPERYISIIKWCLENGYYQQTLTMIESRMSSILKACNMFEYPTNYVERGSIKTEDYLTEHANALNHVTYRIGQRKQFWKRNTDKMNGDDNYAVVRPPRIAIDRVFIKASDNMKAFMVMHTILKNKRNQSNHGFGMNENHGTGNDGNDQNQTNWNALIYCMKKKYDENRKLQSSEHDSIRDAVMYYVNNPNAGNVNAMDADALANVTDADAIENAIIVFVRDMYLGLLEYMINNRTDRTEIELAVRQEPV